MSDQTLKGAEITAVIVLFSFFRCWLNSINYILQPGDIIFLELNYKKRTPQF